MLLPRCKKEKSHLPIWVRGVFGFLILYGMVSFLGNMLLAVFGADLPIPNSWQFPLSLPGAIAVDEGARVYCFSAFNGRIQEYDGSGGFVRGWFTPAGGGTAFVKINDKHELEVLAARGGIVFVYDSEGRMVDTRNGDDEYDDFPKELTTGGSGQDSLVWEIRHPWFYPSIVKMNGSGGEVTLVQVSIFAWPMCSPFAAILMVSVGGGLLKYFEGRARIRDRE